MKGKRWCLFNELLITDQMSGKMKELLGGENAEVAVKFAEASRIGRVPCILTNNHMPWKHVKNSMNREALDNRCDVHKWSRIEWDQLPWQDKSADLHPGCYEKLIDGITKTVDKHEEKAIHGQINSMVDLIVKTVGVRDYDYSERGKVLMGALVKDVMDKNSQ